MKRTGARFPIVGHLPAYLHDKLAFLTACAAREPAVAEMDLGGRTLLVNHAEAIGQVLVSAQEKYEKSPRIIGFGKPLFGESLHASTGPTHVQRRSAVAPLFRRQAIEGFAERIGAIARESAESWTDGSEVEIRAEMFALCRRITIAILFGDTARAEEMARLVEVRRRFIAHTFEYGPLAPFLPPFPADFRRATARLRELLVREMEKPSSGLAGTLWRALGASESAAGLNRWVDEVMALAGAGYEPLMDGLTWALYLLASHPEEEARVLQEIESVVRGDLPSADEVGQLERLSMAFAEALRLYPPTWIFVRIAREEDVLPGGVRVAPGDKIFLSQYVTHRHPRYYEDPLRFAPSRFAPGAVRERPAFSYFPFGGGARGCIGQGLANLEALLILAVVLPRWKLELVAGQTIRPVGKITLQPARGIRMRLKRRQARAPAADPPA